MPLTCRDTHTELSGIGRKLIRGRLLACIVIIMLHHLSAKDDIVSVVPLWRWMGRIVPGSKAWRNLGFAFALLYAQMSTGSRLFLYIT